MKEFNNRKKADKYAEYIQARSLGCMLLERSSSTVATLYQYLMEQ